MITTATFEKTIAIVRELGIDPDMISKYGIDVNGYNEFEINPTESGGGRKIVKDDLGQPQWVFIRRQWPTEHDGLRIVEQYILEGGYKL